MARVGTTGRLFFTFLILCLVGAITCDDHRASESEPSNTNDDDSDDDDDNDDDSDDDDDNDDDSDDDDDDAPVPDYDTKFEGFGRGATGGAGGSIALVTSLNDDGPGTLRDSLRQAKGPVLVRFEVDGAIEMESLIDLPSDVTVDARGRDVTIRNHGFRIDSQSNIIIMNLAFRDVSGDTGDAVQIMNESSDIVIFHCLFDSEGLMPFVQDIPDEQISIVWGSTNVTVSWCRFRFHDKVLLFGNGDAPPQLDANIAVTLHHNLFEITGRRHPFLRHGRVDMYNNVIRDWRFYLRLPYATRSQQDAQILVQANWYIQSNPLFFVGSFFKLGGKIRLIDNEKSNDWIRLVQNRPDEVFERPYLAGIQPLTDSWLAMMEMHTGNTMPVAKSPR